MPVCRECHARITKFDKDRCPVCGCLNPIDTAASETVEITSNLDISTKDFQGYKPKFKKTLLVLFCLLGFTGAPAFYLGYKKAGLITLLVSLLIIGGFGSLLAFLTPLSFAFGYVVPLAALYFANIVFGVILYNKNSLKDKNGDFLR